MAPKLLLLDSGAFSVWNRGHSIDLQAYIEFCVREKASYYVNLDVIPGKPNDPQSLTAAARKEAARAGWTNYREMKSRLPIEQVVPVFHQGDDMRWIGKYLDDGVQYLGISPANDRTTEQKLRWLHEVRPYLCDAAGNPVVKTHGFAVTSYRLMKFWHWYSVDSASWLRQAALGGVYVPGPAGRYSESPRVINFSPRSPAKHKRGEHWTTLTPTVKRLAFAYLTDVLGMTLGKWLLESEPLPEGTQPAEDQRWFDKAKRRVIRILEPGLQTCHQRRFYANMRYLQEANKVLPVDHIFFAGSGTRPKIEKELGRRLISYADVSTGNTSYQLFKHHQDMLGT